jgi:hypothetical protein
MSKHTPGPWHWGYDYYGLFGENDEPVLCYMPYEGMDLEGSYDREEANARLIAAAPDLLEELKTTHGILAAALLIIQDDFARQIASDQLAANRAAIAKAEGQ